MIQRAHIYSVLVSLLVLTVGAWPVQAQDKLRLGYFANLTHAQAVLGAANGEFAKAIAPVQFSTKVFNAGPSLIEALFAGEIDIGYVGPGPVLNAFAKSRGEGIRVIAGSAGNGVVIVARKGSGINSLADLKGKKIATPQHGNTQDIAARHYITSVLKDADTNNIVPIPNAEQAALMDRGQIDAAWAPEPWGALLVKQTGATIIGEEKDLWSSKQFTLTVVVTTPEFLAKHADVVEKVLRVHDDLTQRLKNDTAGNIELVGKAIGELTGKRLPEGVAGEASKRITFSVDLVPDTFEQYAQWSTDLGFLKRKPKLDSLIDTSILQRVRVK